MAGLAVAAIVAVGTSAHAQNLTSGNTQQVFLASHVTSVAPTAVSLLGAPDASTNFSPLISSQLNALGASRRPSGDTAFTASVTPDLSISAGAGFDTMGHFNGYDLAANNANDGLFLSASAAPYTSTTSGGNFVGATVALASDLHFSAGHAALPTARTGFDVPLFSALTMPSSLTRSLLGRSAQSSFAGVDWNFATGAGFNLTASQSDERNSLLGNVNDAALAEMTAKTNAVSASAHVAFDGGWVTTVTYAQGVSQLDLKPTGDLLGNTDLLHTKSYGVSIAKHGLFADDDSLGIAVSRPIQMFAGHLGVASAIAPANAGAGNPSLLGGAPETDLELGYVTSFFNGALNLQANAAYQFNAEGQNGSNSLAVLSRAKINF
jgi:hypothetical protein